jgi:hypothetical protein
MATRSKSPRQSKRKAEGGADKAASTPSEPEDSPATIRKGIYLSTLIYVEGDQAPAEDFAAAAKRALQEAISGAQESVPGGLRITVKSVRVQNDVEEDDQDAATAPAKKDEFEF